MKQQENSWEANNRCQNTDSCKNVNQGGDNVNVAVGGCVGVRSKAVRVAVMAAKWDPGGYQDRGVQGRATTGSELGVMSCGRT